MSHDRQILRALQSREILWRGLYGTTHGGSEYVVEVDYFDFDECIKLYCDGVLIDSQKSPAKFLLEDGSVIEAAMSLYGMKIARLVSPNAFSKKLKPLSGTAESRRDAFSVRYPALNKTISAVAWFVLAAALMTQIPNLINSFGYFIGFSVPSLDLPDALNVFLGVAGIVAGLDRGLRMKHNPLLDS